MSKDIKLGIVIDQRGNASKGIKGLLASLGGFLVLKDGLEALGGAIADSVGKASELSAQMSTIGARSNATAGEVENLKDLVSDLALDPKLKVSAFEAAAAIEELAAGGVAIEDIMTGAAAGTVALANAVGGDFGQAAEVAASSMAIFGVEAEDMTSVVNGVTAVVVASKFDLNDYALALAQAGGAAQTSGVEMEDFNTALAAISPLFASGSDAGTSFKTFLQRMVPDTKPAIGAMKELGIITEEAGNRFFDADGSLKSMAEISGILDEALSGLSEEQRNSALQTIFGTDAMRAAVGLMKEGEAGFTALQATMAKTSGADAAAMMMDNLAGDTEILRGQVEGLQISYGDKLLPALRNLAGFTSDYLAEKGPAFVESFASLSIKVLDVAQVALPQLIEKTAAFSDLLSARLTPDMTSMNASLDKISLALGLSSGAVDVLDLAFGALELVIIPTTIALDGLAAVLVVLAGATTDVSRAVEIVKKLWADWEAIVSSDSTRPAVVAVKALSDGVRQLLNPIGAVINAWNNLKKAWQSAMDGIPDAFMPGSPTPFEIGLRGIAAATSDIGRKAPAAFTGFAGKGGVGSAPLAPALAAAPGALAGAGAGGSFVINFTYSPVISLADRFEAQNVLAPFIAEGVRAALAKKVGR